MKQLFNNIKNRPLALLFSLCILISLPPAALPDDQFQIFMLHSYSQEYPWTKLQHEGFTSTYDLHNKSHTLISTEYLDTKRKNYTAEYAEQFSAYLKIKYAGYQPDLIYVTDDNATRFAIDWLSQQFPSAPVIFSGVNDFSIQNELDPGKFTGVFEKKDIQPNLKLLKSIDSNINNIIVVGDSSNTYKAIKVEIEAQLKQQPEIKATYVSSQRLDTILHELRELKSGYLFLTTIGSVTDSNNHSLTLKETINLISMSGDFIIVSMEDAYLLGNVLGGFVTSGKQQGVTAARLSLNYKNGTSLNKIKPVLVSPNEFIFDYLELSKNKLKLPQDLISDSKIINKPATFYQKNIRLIIITSISLAVLLIISMGVFLVLLSYKNRRIHKTSKKIKSQSYALQRAKDTLANAQTIAHLGNWEWNLKNGRIDWSDELYNILGEKPDNTEKNFNYLLSFVPENERDMISEVIKESTEKLKPFELEHTILKQDGSVRYIRQVGDIHQDLSSDARILIGTVLDITKIKKSEVNELERLSKIEKFQNALFEWSRVDYENIAQAFERATEISANTLNISRVSIWLYNEDYSSIECNNLYIRNKGHEKGLILNKTDFPAYFRAVETGKMIVVNHARTDKNTKEFTEPYLIPNNIYSMLDAPILYAGNVIGVVCHEVTDVVREWSSQEIEFAAAIANTVSLTLEIQKRREIEFQLEHQAYHDALTNLPNRSLFLDRLDQAIKLAHRTSTMIAVLFLDLDNFKEINDSLGHAAGDQVLINVAQNISDNLRDMDTIARLGGDEFTIIMSSFHDTQHIHEVVIKLFNIMQQPLSINEQEIYVTSSIGISIYPADGQTSDTLLRNADAAMYNAKEAGRNSFEFYTHDMTERAFERVLMETNLRRALENEEFIIYYQAQYDASDQKLVGMEALIRWQHPDMGMISPTKFIPVAEDTGLIIQLDRWVMQTAIRQFTQWHNSGLLPGRLALNMAPQQLEQTDLIDYIKSTLQDCDCKPEWLAFEITESQIMKNPEKAISILLEINQLGIEIAVDDFGTGYSSLTYLKRLPVDKLKIDRAFINDVPTDDEDVAIVRAIIALANSLNLSLIAEGVEKIEQVDFLIREGCPHIQGFFFAKPMPAEKIDALLKTHKVSDN